MSINVIDKVGVAQTSLFLIGMASIIAAGDSQSNKKIKTYKQQIMANDSARYKQVNMNSANKPIQVRAKMWEDAYKEMQDSLNKAGQAQKSYLEGGQSAKTNFKETLK